MAKLEVSQRSKVLIEALEEGWISRDYEEDLSDMLEKELLVPHRIMRAYASPLEYNGVGALFVFNDGDPGVMSQKFVQMYSEEATMMHEFHALVHQPDGRKKSRIYYDEIHSTTNVLDCVRIIEEAQTLNSVPLEYAFYFQNQGVVQKTQVAFEGVQMSLARERDIYAWVPAMLEDFFGDKLDEERLAVVSSMLKRTKCYEIKFWTEKESYNIPDAFVEFVKNVMDGKPSGLL